MESPIQTLRGSRVLTVVLCTVVFAFLCFLPATAMETSRICDFETSLDLVHWRQQPQALDSPILSDLHHTNGNSCLELRNSFLSERTLVCDRKQDFSDFSSMSLDVYLPDHAPEMDIMLFVLDTGLNWYQVYESEAAYPGKWTTVVFDLTNEDGNWKSFGHSRPWGDYAKRKVLRFGFKFCPREEGYFGPVFMDNLRAERDSDASNNPGIANVRTNRDRVPQYGKFEITFDLNARFVNPFDSGDIDVKCRITSPSGKEVIVPAFYYQEYAREMASWTERLVPIGEPEWKVRYAPTEPGTYTYSLEACERAATGRPGLATLSRHLRSDERLRYLAGAFALCKAIRGQAGVFPATCDVRETASLLASRLETATGEMAFECVPSANHGFVNVSTEDSRYFEYSNGEFYWPTGLNVCAAYDVRNADLLGVPVHQFEGTAAMEKYLRGMGSHDADFARIWMSCWSLGVEWSHEYHNMYEGLGEYSLKNAWRLDRVMEIAEETGVNVQLTLDTFGHFRMHPNKRDHDEHQDWDSNPFNFQAGGILSYPWYFFTDPDAFALYEQRLDYINARWGYSTALFGWEICNEIDLITPPPGSSGLERAEFDRQLVKWHERTADVLRRGKAKSHPVTTNYASYFKDYNVLEDGGLDYLAANRYVSDLPECMAWIFQDRVNVTEKKTKSIRPQFLLESGADFRGGSITNTEEYLHISLWASWMYPYAGSGMSWWWVVIDQENMYPHFAAFAKYIRGEDKRGHVWQYKQVPEFINSTYPFKGAIGRVGDEKLWGDFKPAADSVFFADSELASKSLLDIRYLHDNHTAYVWIYDKGAYGISTSTHEAKLNEGVVVEFNGLDPGAYDVETWDTWKGVVIERAVVRTDENGLKIELPGFSRDIALKLKYNASLSNEYLR